MRRYLGIGLAWLAATALSVFIASTAVAGIRDRVVDTPVALGAPTTTTTVAPETTSAPTLAPTTSTSTTAATTTTEPSEVTVTTAAETATSTTTTSPPETTTTSTTTTTTTAAPAYSYPTYSLTGGTVTLKVGGGEVHVASASPNTGFHADVEKNGPSEVRVEFESNHHKSVFTASLEDGSVKHDIREEDEDGGDDGHEGD